LENFHFLEILWLIKALQGFQLVHKPVEIVNNFCKSCVFYFYGQLWIMAKPIQNVEKPILSPCSLTCCALFFSIDGRDLL